jgi:hypothetical protein
MLRLFFLFLSLFSGSLTVIIPLNPLQATPIEKEEKDRSQQREQKKTASPYASMTQYQINQVKRYDCRLQKKLLSHKYQEKTIESPTTTITITKSNSTLEK